MVVCLAAVENLIQAKEFAQGRILNKRQSWDLNQFKSEHRALPQVTFLSHFFILHLSQVYL